MYLTHTFFQNETHNQLNTCMRKKKIHSNGKATYVYELARKRMKKKEKEKKKTK